MKISIAITLLISAVAFGGEAVEVETVKPVCEQKLIEEQGRIAIIYIPMGCEYGPWAYIGDKEKKPNNNKK